MQIGSHRSLLGTRRVGNVPNARIKELRGAMKMDGRIDGSVFRWFGHTERMGIYEVVWQMEWVD